MNYHDEAARPKRPPKFLSDIEHSENCQWKGSMVANVVPTAECPCYCYERAIHQIGKNNGVAIALKEFEIDFDDDEVPDLSYDIFDHNGDFYINAGLGCVDDELYILRTNNPDVQFKAKIKIGKRQ